MTRHPNIAKAIEALEKGNMDAAWHLLRAIPTEMVVNEPAPAITPEHLLALAQTARLELDKVIAAFRMAEQPAQQEYTSFAEWANDYVRANLHKLKPAQQEPYGYVSTHTNGQMYFNKTFQGVYRDTATEVVVVYTSPPAQQQEPLQSIPSLTTVLAHLERLLPSEVYNGMVDVIENEFQRKQQPAPVQQAPVAIVRTWHKNGDQHAELDDWGLALALLPDGKHELYPSPPAQRTWVGLTDEEREQHRNDWHSNIHDKEFRAIEAKLKEKNNGN